MGTTVYVYDLRRLLTQETDGRGIVTNYTYDNAGRMLTRTLPVRHRRQPLRHHHHLYLQQP
jgi:YD repeat-containing protein